MEEENIIKEYGNGDGCMVLSSRYKCAPSTIHRILKRNNIRIRTLGEANRLSLKNGNRKSGLVGYNNKKRGYDYFPDKINKTFMYIIGYICGDGYINKYNNNVEISSKDYNHLVKLSNLTTFNKVRTDKRIYYKFIVGGRKLYNYFKLNGIDGAKSKTIKLIKMEDEYFSHFLRGLFDADGCCWKNDKRIKLNIASGCHDFLEEIKKRIKKLINIEFGLYTKKDHFSLEISGRNNVQMFTEFLYDDADIYLERKYDKIFGLLSQEWIR